MKNYELQNDYQYFCVYIGGGMKVDSLPILAVPGSYIFFGGKKFYVAEYQTPKGDKAADYDICVYCDEVPNDVNIQQIRRDLKIDSIIND